MKPEKKREVTGKTVCDVCRKQAPPIHEYRFPFRGVVASAHWVDMCNACGAVDRKMRLGFVQGIHPAYEANAHRGDEPRGYARQKAARTGAGTGKNTPEPSGRLGTRPVRESRSTHAGDRDEAAG